MFILIKGNALRSNYIIGGGSDLCGKATGSQLVICNDDRSNDHQMIINQIILIFKKSKNDDQIIHIISKLSEL